MMENERKKENTKRNTSEAEVSKIFKAKNASN